MAGSDDFRVGMPSKVLTAQGINLMSWQIKEVFMLLGININSTPFYPQTDVMVERFSQGSRTLPTSTICDTQKLNG